VRISPSLQSIHQHIIAWIIVVDGGVVVVPAIAFFVCRRKGGEDGGPRTGSTGLSPHRRTAASPPSPTMILPRVLCL
jgi:hypothetical protein